MKSNIFILSIILLTFTALNVFSQVSREWVSTYNFNMDDGAALVTDNAGYIYVTGKSNNDYTTIKYNSSGDLIWVSSYNGIGNSTDAANAIAVDLSGNVYVTGSSVGVSAISDFATVKYNSSGVQQWAVRYGGTMTSEAAVSLAVDNSGNVYVTGYVFNIASNNDYATVKYNSSGILQWAKSYNGIGNQADFVAKVVIDDLSNAYVTGSSRGSGSSDDNFATIKYSPAGDELWIKIYEGPGDGFDQATSIAVDTSYNVYVTGRSLGVTSQYDYATIKYNSSGDSVWVQRYNGADNSSDNPASIAIDRSGNVYVVGQSLGSLSDYDFATVKYNSSGVYQWDRIYNGPGNSVENAKSIALDSSGNVYITGSSAFPGQNYNYATVKYSSTGIQQWSDTYNGTAGGSDESFSIAADNFGNVYVTGSSAGLGQLKDYVTIKYNQKPVGIITGIIEGFYNSATDKMKRDTVKIYIRNSFSPYSLVDSSVSKPDSSGLGKFYFNGVSNGVNYYIELKHRNSIRTWSSTWGSFTSGSMIYNFSSAITQAFGNNMKQIDTTPLRFAIFSGDVNQDGIIDAGDLSQVENDAGISLVGYENSDVTGDDFADAADVSIVENNIGVTPVIP